MTQTREQLEEVEQLQRLTGHPGWHLLRDHLTTRRTSVARQLVAPGVSPNTRSELAAEWRVLDHVLDDAIPTMITERGGSQ